MTPNQRPYLTVAAPAKCEIPAIKGSRFIGLVAPIDSDQAATAFVESVKADFPDARHWCWAYQLRQQSRTRFNDDGEPSGSAGKPILAPIVGRQLFDCVIVVVRYFGGVKLGVGGLVRAYSQAANAVLTEANIVEVIPKVTLSLRYGYDCTSQIAAALANLGLVEDEVNYADCVSATLQVLPDAVETTISQLTNYTAGRACVKIVEP